MDLNTVIGALLAFGLVIVAMAVGPGGVGIFIHIPSLTIVLVPYFVRLHLMAMDMCVGMWTESYLGDWSNTIAG